MKILILDPSWPGNQGVSSNSIVTAITGGAPQQNYGAMCVAQSARIAGYDTEFFQAPYHGTQFDVTEKLQNIDVLGLSLMQWNTLQGMTVAEIAKMTNPKIKVAVGGVFPSCAPEYFTPSSSVDAVFVGEGEESFANWLKKGLPDGIIGSKRLNDWGKYEAPVDQTILKQLYFRGLAPAGNAWGFYSTRGCAGRCSFCCTPRVFPGAEIADNVFSAVNRLTSLHKQGVDGVDINNATFNDDPALVQAFCKTLGASGLKMPWTAMCGTHGADFKLYQKMKSAGCFKVGFGIEDPVQKGRSILKKRGFRASCCSDSLKAAHDAGLLVRGYFMLGAPWQNQETVDNFYEILSYGLIDEPRLSFMTPFLGTSLYKKMASDGQILDSDWSHYTTNRPVINHPFWSANELMDIQRKIIGWFWSQGPGQSNMLKRIKNDPKMWIPRYRTFLERDLIPNGFIKQAELPKNIFGQ
jgi:anaerobic magnesium-protoporphyrin IX monomethyl ester cyclase